jgi:hypothetical protein
MIEEKIGALPTWITTGRGEMTKGPQITEGGLTEEQKQVLTVMQGIKKEAREAWIRIGGYLSEQLPDRRTKDTGHNPERRLGDRRYSDGHDTSGYVEKSPDKPGGQSQKRRNKND